jgi:hypothetical protein
MGREEKRAKSREEAKEERASERPTRSPSTETLRTLSEEHIEAQQETARRIHLTGGPSERRRKPKRRVSEKPLKWREGHQ